MSCLLLFRLEQVRTPLGCAFEGIWVTRIIPAPASKLGVETKMCVFPHLTKRGLAPAPTSTVPCVRAQGREKWPGLLGTELLSSAQH